MNNSLANPRRTKLMTWPSQGSENPDQEQSATTADSAPSPADEPGTGQ
ncbi:hypothetical protein [Actinomadura sp. 9N407]